MTERLELLSLVLFFIIISIISSISSIIEKHIGDSCLAFHEDVLIGKYLKYYFFTDGFDFNPM